MKKVLLKALALLLLALIPFGMLASAIAFMPPTFEKTFLGALSLKYDRLSSLEGEKMIVIGGSSVAFGLDSEMLCELVDMPVVNFGLYASLGTKIMMDMAMGEIDRGDVVVLAPELDAQTLSLYFNAESAWQAVDADKSLLWAIGTQNFGDMMGGAVNHLVSKLEYFGETLDPQGVYNRASFDEYGDIVFSRPYNVMTFGYDINKTIQISEEIYSAEFIDYVNDFVRFCEKRGARVCYTFPPMNESAIESGVTSESYASLYRFLSAALDCEVIGSPENYVMNSKYFYDSNFHPNSAGAAHHTSHLAQDLRRFLGITELCVLTLPEPEDRPLDFGGGEDGESDWESLFIYEEKLDNTGALIGYAVVGVKDAGLEMTTLEIPRTHDGRLVMEIGERAFDDCIALRAITIRDNIVSIVSGAFGDCLTLESLHIYNEDESSMSVDQVNLFEGANENISIYLYSEKSFESYVTGYFWANYGSMMKRGYSEEK